MNAVGEGSLSNERSATPAASATVPGAPTLNCGDGRQRQRRARLERAGLGRRLRDHRLQASTAARPAAARRSSPRSATSRAAPTPAVVNGTTYYYKVSRGQRGRRGHALERALRDAHGAATIPGAPTLNSATAGSGSVALAWSAPASNGGSRDHRLQGLPRHDERRRDPPDHPRQRHQLDRHRPSRTATTYYYKVTAVNGVGEGVLSNESSRRPAARESAPGAPTLNSAIGGNASVVLALVGSGVRRRLGDHRLQGLPRHHERRRDPAEHDRQLTGYTDGGLTNGTTYFYKVAAVNSVGEGALSSERSAIPATVPSPPTLAPSGAGNGQVSVNWTPPSSNGGSAITGYKVYRGTASGAETLLVTLGNVTGYNDSAVTNGTTYYYKVSAVNALGESFLSGEQSATPTTGATAPGAPTLGLATPGNSSVALVWTPPASNGGSAITAYKIYRGTSSGGEALLTTLGNVTSFTDTGLANGTTYFYKVTAVNAMGEGSMSNELSATASVGADTTPPSTPSNVTTPLAGTSQVVVVWTASTDNVGVTGYQVYRDGLPVGTVATTHYLDTGMSAGSTHSYQVRAIDAAGLQSALSTSRSAILVPLGKNAQATLGGIVYDRTGRALPNVAVTLTLSGAVKTATTGADGVWTIGKLSAGSYVVSARLAGFQTATFSVNAASRETLLAVTTLQ